MHLLIQWRCKLRSAAQPAFVHICIYEKYISTGCDDTSLHVCVSGPVNVTQC